MRLVVSSGIYYSRIKMRGMLMALLGLQVYKPDLLNLNIIGVSILTIVMWYNLFVRYSCIWGVQVLPELRSVAFIIQIFITKKMNPTH
jgi:hypothetical protein